MIGFLSASLWIALVTVVPGLVTVAAVYGALVLVDGDLVHVVTIGQSDWIWLAITVAVMVLTQAFGILLEDALVKGEYLGESEEVVPVEGVLGDTRREINPYEQYRRLYPLAVRLTETDDAHAHLERAIAQFFLTINTLVSFSAGILVVVVLVGASIVTGGVTPGVLLRGGLYLGVLIAFLWASYRTAIARFEVMAVSIYSIETWKRDL